MHHHLLRPNRPWPGLQRQRRRQQQQPTSAPAMQSATEASSFAYKTHRRRRFGCCCCCCCCFCCCCCCGGVQFFLPFGRWWTRSRERWEPQTWMIAHYGHSVAIDRPVASTCRTVAEKGRTPVSEQKKKKKRKTNRRDLNRQVREPFWIGFRPFIHSPRF